MKVNKILATLLAVVMIIGMLPTMAWAAVTTYQSNGQNLTVELVIDDPSAAYFISDNSTTTSFFLNESGQVPADYKIKYEDTNDGEGYDLQNANGGNIIHVNKGYKVKNGFKKISGNLYFMFDVKKTDDSSSEISAGTALNKSTYYANVEDTLKLKLNFEKVPSSTTTTKHTITVAAYPADAGSAANIYNNGSTVKQIELEEDDTLPIGGSASPYLYATQNPVGTDTNYTYTFDGWYVADYNGEPGTAVPSTGYKVGNSDATLLAKYIKTAKVRYNVTLAAGGHGSLNEGENPKLIDAGSAVYNYTLSAYPKPDTGYQFAGWYSNEDLVVDDSHYYTPTGDITLTAKFVLKQYDVTFDSDGGSAVAKKTIEHGSTATAPDAPTKDGYTFDGWFAANSETAFDFDTPITSNIALTAHWTKVESEEPVTPEEPGDTTMPTPANENFLTDSTKFRLNGQIDLFGADVVVNNDFATTVKVYKGYEGLYGKGNRSLNFGMNGATTFGLAANEKRTNSIPVGNVNASVIDNGSNVNLYDTLFNVINATLFYEFDGDTVTINAGGKRGTYSLAKSANDNITTLTATPTGNSNFAGVWTGLFNSSTISSTVAEEKSEFYVAAGSSFQLGDEMRTINENVTAPLTPGNEFDTAGFLSAFYGNIGPITSVDKNTDKFILTLKAGTALQLGESRVELLKDLTITVSGLHPKTGMVTALAANTSAKTLDLINDWLSVIQNVGAVTINAEFDESAEDFVGENVLRVAGSLDLFGADLQVCEDYTGSLKIYKGYDGLGGVRPTIRIVANGLGSSTSVVDKTINVGNVGIDALKTAVAGTSIDPENITYGWLYNVFIDPLTKNIAKQTVVLHYNDYSKTINFFESEIKDGENNTVGKTITFTGSGAGFNNTLEDLVGSEAGATILTSYNENAPEQIKFTLVEGSYIRVGNETRTLKTSLNDVSLLDVNGEVDLEPFKDAMMGDIEKTVVTGENDSNVVIELLGGTTFTVGRTTVTITKPMRLTVAGLNVEDDLISTISGMIESPNNFGMSDISKLTSIIPTSAGTVHITLEVIEPEVAQIGGTKYATLAAAVAEAQKGDKIELIDDIYGIETVIIPKAKNITLDLNGHSIEAGLESAGRHYYAIENHGIFTLMDSNPGATNGVYARGISNESDGTMIINSGCSLDIDSIGGAAIWNEGTLTINGGLFKTTYVGSSSESGGPGCLYNSGSATINGGTFNSVNERCYAIINDGDMTIEDATVNGAHGALSTDYGTLTVNGGTFTCTNFYGLWITNDGNETVVTVNGGSFTGGLYGLYATVDDGKQDEGDVTVTVTGGYFKGGTAPAVAIKKGTSEHSWGMTITGGKFSSVPDSDYIATGYKAVDNTDDDMTTYLYKVVEQYTEQSTTDTSSSKTTTTMVEDDTTITTSTGFAVDNTAQTPTYAIKTEVITTVGEAAPETTTTYTKVTVATDTAATVAEGVKNSGSAAKDAVVAAVDAYNGSAGSATFTAALAANEVATTDKVLQTTAAANAIAKAAAELTSVQTATVSEAKVILKTELKSFEASTTDSSKAKKVTYDITPVAQLYKAGTSGLEAIGEPVALNNEDIKEGETFTFSIPVPSNMTADKIKVSHIGTNGYATEIGTYTPTGSGVRYITVTVDHFSEFELEETTVAELGTAKVTANLSLQDEIKINFKVSNLSKSDSSYSVEYKFGDGATVTKYLSEVDDTTDGVYKFVVASCAAKQMTDTVSFKLYCDDTEIFSYVYSIRQYCVNKINANSDAKLVALCRAILDYGAEAQTYFDYKTEALANADSYGNGGSLPIIDSYYNNLSIAGLSSYSKGISKVNANLTLESNTELNFKLTAGDVNKITDVTVTSSGSEAVTCTTSNSDDVMTIKVKGIAAKYLDHVYTLSFNYEGVANSIQYSPLTYAYRNQNKTSDNLGSLCKALYQYWYTAKAYLN